MTRRPARMCLCASKGCRRCLLGYHHAQCAADHQEARARRTIRYHAARKALRRRAR